jgi:hypothetical protein
MNASIPRYRTLTGAASLVIGPALMSSGDLLHPAESFDVAAQAAIIQQTASRWYVAHLLLFVGLMLLIPGFLVLTREATFRRPVAGYVARLLIVASIGAFSAVFTLEMLIGRVISKGTDQATAVVLLETFQSAEILGALAPVLLAFFIGVGLTVMSLATPAGPFRWPALIMALGAALILGEIVLAEVRLSQIGNILMLVAGVGLARVLLREQDAMPA